MTPLCNEQPLRGKEGKGGGGMELLSLGGISEHADLFLCNDIDSVRSLCLSSTFSFTPLPNCFVSHSLAFIPYSMLGLILPLHRHSQASFYLNTFATCMVLSLCLFRVAREVTTSLEKPSIISILHVPATHLVKCLLEIWYCMRLTKPLYVKEHKVVHKLIHNINITFLIWMLFSKMEKKLFWL